MKFGKFIFYMMLNKKSQGGLCPIYNHIDMATPPIGVKNSVGSEKFTNSLL